ncbi:MAG: hypothetical protein J6W96_02875, partial [Alphaproteobacteria bacterium]|nr:hypothetical protein [Alphaproteobacteria bacterium]
IKTIDMIKALVFPLVALIAFFGYLYYYDIIGVYFLSNYTFNLNLADGFELSKVVKLPYYIMILTILGWLGVVYFCFHPNRYFGVLVALFVCEFLQRKFYFSPYAYYYWLMVYLSVLCAVPMLVKFNQFGRLFGVTIIVCLCFWGGKSITAYRDFIKATENRPYLPDFVTRNITPCDYVFNGDGLMYNIFAKDPAYYWQLIGQLDVIGEKTGVHPRPDINALIEKYKPKFVFGANYFNKFADEGGVKEIVHYVDQSLIEKYYAPTIFYPVYQLKSEFNNRKCVQNLSGQWEYQKEADVK